MNDKDWFIYDSKMRNNTREWSNYNYSKCYENKPSNDKLFKNKTVSEDGYWEISLHPWCGSCYNAYIEVCSKVADSFNLYIDKKGHWDRNDLKKAIIRFVEETKNVDPVTWLVNHEIKLINIIDCINLRAYENDSCFKISSTHGLTKDGNIYGEIKHIEFIKFLCRSLLKLFLLYETKLFEYNTYHTKKQKKNILVDINPYTSNLCQLLFLEDKALILSVKNKKEELDGKNKLKTELLEDYNLELKDTFNFKTNTDKFTHKNLKSTLNKYGIKPTSKTPPKRKSKRNKRS